MGLWMIAYIIISYFLLNKSRFGARLLATGGNAYAAEIEGVNVKFIKTSAFILSSISAYFATLLLLGRASSYGPGFGGAYLLVAIAGSIMGGNIPGKGTIPSVESLLDCHVKIV